MRRMTIALAGAVVLVGMSVPVAAAQAAPPPRPQTNVRADQPPFPYADCIAAAKKKGESPGYAKWHCDELVKKGWIKPPNG
ncbi:hypothetical protein LE181_03345 [Streptomyces sp. SCA3-4]|uniref:hypothetical protein n=1 Tax=Streptomyces sichuanensis TaxID=2871810 RepID=UPI001CE33750|nr:hypothetical protein [Streptomyces sichuanensis]MCA6091204.1 hypothetical protein [Streptomyces sichuanensis]